MSFYIVVPTYNEKENIPLLLNKVKEVFTANDISGGVIVVDDNSPDGTANIVSSLQDTIKTDKFSVELIVRQGKLGLGTAYIAGFKKAIDIQADYIMEMDADFSHNPEYIPAFVEALKTNHVVVGSRYITDGNVEAWSKLRQLISRSGSLYSRLILGWKIKDATAGFVAYQRQVLETINLDEIKSNGYSFQVEMKYHAYKLGFTLKEIPIVFVDRVVGQSKMSSKIVFEALIRVLGLRTKVIKPKGAVVLENKIK
jgi:dolichol-phosphate mannosyltransferase